MGRQGIFRHKLLGNLPRKPPFDASLDVNFGEFIQLGFRALAQLLARREIRLLGVGLRADGYILASSHRHSARHEPRHARNQDIISLRSGRGDADDQACGRDDAVVAAKTPLSSTRCGRRGGAPNACEDGSFFSSDSPKRHKDNHDDQDRAQRSNAAVAEAVSVAAEAAAEAAKQENDDDD